MAVHGQCIYPELWGCLQDCVSEKAATFGEMFSSCLTGSKACDTNCEADALLEKQCGLSEATPSEAPAKVEWVTKEGKSVRGGAQVPLRHDAWGWVQSTYPSHCLSHEYLFPSDKWEDSLMSIAGLGRGICAILHWNKESNFYQMYTNSQESKHQNVCCSFPNSPLMKVCYLFQRCCNFSSYVWASFWRILKTTAAQQQQQQKPNQPNKQNTS